MDVNNVNQEHDASINETKNQEEVTVNSNKSNKMLIILGVLFIVLLIFMAAYISIAKNTQRLLENQASLTSKASPSPSTKFIGNYDVVVKPVTSCKNPSSYAYCKADIYLKDKNTGKETFYLTLDNVISNNDIRIPVYRNGRLFILKVFMNESNTSDYYNELWMYQDNGQEKKLLTQKSIEYQANSNGSFVAVVPTLSVSGNAVQIINLSDSTKPTIQTIDMNLCIPDPEIRKWIGDFHVLTWDTQGTTIWGDYEAEHGVQGCFWNVKVHSNTVDYYPVASGIGALEGLNTDKLVAVYTDHPPFVEAESANLWIAEHPTYSLYLYNLVTKESTKIDTLPSAFGSGYYNFVKGWATPTHLVYSTPTGDKTYKLTQ